MKPATCDRLVPSGLKTSMCHTRFDCEKIRFSS